MKLFPTRLIGASLLALIPSLAIAGADPAAYLKAADNIRNPSDTFRMLIDVETKKKTQVFDVYLKGKTKTLIVTKKPVKDSGRNMLMVDQDFYTYIPNLKRSVRLSLAQKLMGQVANGDIARTRWSGDYSAEIEKKTGKTVQLLLTAEKKNLTYNKIRLWVSAKSKRPLKAEYLSTNGKTVLKKAFFEDYRKIAGKTRPGTIRIQSVSGDENYIRIKEMQKKDLTDSFFTKRNMERMR